MWHVSHFCRYTKSYNRVDGWRMLKYKPGSDDCIFLGPDNKCAVHAVRPLQCATYPWWPELVADVEAWQREKGAQGCCVQCGVIMTFFLSRLMVALNGVGWLRMQHAASAAIISIPRCATHRIVPLLQPQRTFARALTIRKRRRRT